MINICMTTCWPCKFERCFDPPQAHSWADAEDRELARRAGQPEPTGLCGCPCAQEET